MKVDIALTEDRELGHREIRLDDERYAGSTGSSHDRTEITIKCHPNNPILDVVSSYFNAGRLHDSDDMYSVPGLYETIFHTKNYRRESEFVLELCDFDDPATKRALLVGCGPGHHSRYLSKTGVSVHGVDPSEEMLAEARQNSDGTFRKGKLPHVDVESKFDLVWCPFSVLNLIPTEELDAALQNLRQLVGDGGYLVVDCATFSPMSQPNVQLISTDTDGCLLLYKYEEQSETAVEWESVVWYEDTLLTDSQTLYTHPYDEIRSQLGQSGSLTEVDGWYGFSTPLSDSKIFVLHDQ